MLCVLLSTLACRIREYDLVNLVPYSTISDGDLDSVVRDVQALFPNIGYRPMLGELTRRGIVIQHAYGGSHIKVTERYQNFVWWVWLKLNFYS